MTQSQFNKVRGLKTSSSAEHGFDNDDGIKDIDLFTKKSNKRKSKSTGGASEAPTDPVSSGAPEEVGSTKKKRKANAEAYFHITVRDNGCGMSHEAIPNLLGRVLSGSKYGVRQTRGKFGLGAKMALIWSKKSTGVPITITTSHMNNDQGTPGEFISKCVLDIDIYKNRPRVIEHSKKPNNSDSPWIGTEFQVLIAGNWTTYKSRVVQYLQQLAIITPYAMLELNYTNASDAKRSFGIRYERRSEQMPPPSKEVKHHPSSLLERSRCKTFLKFLCTELSSISPSLAKRLIAELKGTQSDADFDEDMSPADVTDKQITILVQMLRSVELFKAPDGSCLSPLGEYNLNLGIQKVIEPDLIATARDRPSAYEGHPFIVEAAVSLGGSDAKEGINIVRFANRIPLLFEGGADVATRVAQSKIKWSLYKIDHKRDKINVFVSIVSTKVPFKGTGKEYIGDDITEIQTSVKRALQSCCQQLRAHLTKRNALRDERERRSRLVKYAPDVSRSIFGILEVMKKRKEEDVDGSSEPHSFPRKRARGNLIQAPVLKHVLDPALVQDTMGKLDRGEISVEKLEHGLMEAIEAQSTSGDGMEGGDGNINLKNKNAKKTQKLGQVSQPIFIVPQYDDEDASATVIRHPLFTFRSNRPLPVWPITVD
eukprot:scaffold65976_cov46-Attheya_sp.AAC.3